MIERPNNIKLKLGGELRVYFDYLKISDRFMNRRGKKK